MIIEFFKEFLMIELDNVDEISYVGSFWLPDTPENSFSGTITFSKEKKIFIKYTGFIKTKIDLVRLASSDVKLLHGFVENIGKITCINCIPSGGTSNLGQESYFVEKYTVSSVIVGIHCFKDEKIFTGISFHFNELNSFCVPFSEQYFIADNTPLIDCNIDTNYKVQLKQGKKECIDLSFAMHSYGTKYDKTLLKELENKTQNMQLSKPFYFFHITGEPQTVGTYIDKRGAIEKLFSIFFLKKINSLYSFLKIDNQEYQLIDFFTLKNASKENFYMASLPVCIHNIRNIFSNAITVWNNILKFSLVNTFLTDKLYNNATAGIQQYSIIVALIGAWQVNKGSKYDRRYEDFFVTYLSASNELNKGLTTKLREILGPNKTLQQIATDIRDIRNTILHIDTISPNDKKIKKYGTMINNGIDISNLCEILFIMIIKVIYSELGISLTSSQEGNLLRQCLLWQSISY